MKLPRLHLVTDGAVLTAPGFEDTARAVLGAGGPRVALHVRGHDLPASVLYRIAERVATLVAESGSWLLVNDRLDVALAIQARFPHLTIGAQLGRRSIPVAVARLLLGRTTPVGYSAHDAGEAAAAAESGADFVAFGHVYPTATHPGLPGVGPEAIRHVAAGLRTPVLAIGGVSPSRVPELLAAGAYGVAVIRGVWGDDEPAEAVTRFLAALDAAARPASQASVPAPTGGGA